MRGQIKPRACDSCTDFSFASQPATASYPATSSCIAQKATQHTQVSNNAIQKTRRTTTRETTNCPRPDPIQACALFTTAWQPGSSHTLPHLDAFQPAQRCIYHGHSPHSLCDSPSASVLDDASCFALSYNLPRQTSTSTLSTHSSHNHTPPVIRKQPCR